MTLSKLTDLSRLLIPVAGLCAVAVTAFAAVRIGGSAFSANGQLARDYQYTGACPVELKFDWGVIGTEASTVVYTTSRNDGASTAPRSINLPASNRSVPVITTWRLGANTPQFRNYNGWVQINIQSPNPVSNKIGFTIHCQ
jgi:hypothetical protein